MAKSSRYMFYYIKKNTIPEKSSNTSCIEEFPRKKKTLDFLRYIKNNTFRSPPNIEIDSITNRRVLIRKQKSTLKSVSPLNVLESQSADEINTTSHKKIHYGKIKFQNVPGKIFSTSETSHFGNRGKRYVRYLWNF